MIYNRSSKVKHFVKKVSLISEKLVRCSLSSTNFGTSVSLSSDFFIRELRPLTDPAVLVSPELKVGYMLTFLCALSSPSDIPVLSPCLILLAAMKPATSSLRAPLMTSKNSFNDIEPLLSSSIKL